MTERKQRIEKIAYQLWEQEGRPAGESHSHRFWLAAEAQYEAEIAKDRAQPAGKKPAGSAKPKSDHPPAEMPPAAPARTKTAEPPAKTKAVEPPTEKKPSLGKAKTSEPAAAKPSGGAGKRKPGAK